MITYSIVARSFEDLEIEEYLVHLVETWKTECHVSANTTSNQRIFYEGC